MENTLTRLNTIYDKIINCDIVSKQLITDRSLSELRDLLEQATPNSDYERGLADGIKCLMGRVRLGFEDVKLRGLLLIYDDANLMRKLKIDQIVTIIRSNGDIIISAKTRRYHDDNKPRGDYEYSARQKPEKYDKKTKYTKKSKTFDNKQPLAPMSSERYVAALKGAQLLVAENNQEVGGYKSKESQVLQQLNTADWS